MDVYLAAVIQNILMVVRKDLVDVTVNTIIRVRPVTSVQRDTTVSLSVSEILIIPFLRQAQEIRRLVI